MLSFLRLTKGIVTSAATIMASDSSSSSTSTVITRNISNVLGTPLQPCSFAPLTGYFRDGYCRMESIDRGRHVIAAQVTKEFLEFSKTRGNDLMTPRPEYNFPGLKPGDRWCLCALRWKEAYEAGVAPPVDLEATDTGALLYVNIDMLKKHALPLKNTTDSTANSGKRE